MTLLAVTDLRVAVPAGHGRSHPVDGVSFSLDRGECLAVVGGSGAGKSLTAMAVTGLLPPGARVASGAIRLDGEDLTTMPPRQLASIRGRRIGMVFQDPQASLNPVLSIGHQLEEAILAHRTLPRAGARARALELLHRAGLPEPGQAHRAWPHQLSGGQRQRALIAIALAGDPDLLLADEPTSALDVTVQAGVLDLLSSLRRERGLAMLLITHDLAVAATQADRIAVLRQGQVVETGPAAEVLASPAHEYTAALRAAVPSMPEPAR